MAAQTESLPIIQASIFLSNPTSPEAIEECKKAADALYTHGALIIKDLRVSEKDNDRFFFLDMMERYYSLPDEIKMKDSRPELHYQLGSTPSFVEVPRDHSQRIATASDESKPQTPIGADPKWRFFWRIGDRPASTKYPELNSEQVIPENFPEWTEVMNLWGSLMFTSVSTVAEMTAVGFGLDRNAFSSLMKSGPHLLAPTGSNLNTFNKLETVLAGYHYDLNFLTIHGKSRFPSLSIWLRNGKKMLVRVPDGCLLVQAGKQAEILTGGQVLAGFHEVIVNPETIEAIERRKKQNHCLWRVSSTFFSHIASDNILRPLGHFSNLPDVEKHYPTIEAGEQVLHELNLINLGVNNSMM